MHFWILLMIALYLLFSSCQAKAADVILHGPTVHHGMTPPNTNNYGLGLCYEFDSTLEGQVGFYENSFKRESYYAIAGLTAWRQGPWSAGVFGGVVTGYKNNEKLGGPLAAGVFGRWQYDRILITVRSVPVRKGFTSVEVGWHF